MGNINDIDLTKKGNWKNYEHIWTNSLWIVDRSDRAEANNASYHGNFIPEIPRQAILRYTKSGDTILDPFIGLGTSAIEAMSLGRHTIGFDINNYALTQAAIQVKSHSISLKDDLKVGRIGGVYFQSGDSTNKEFLQKGIVSGLNALNQDKISLAIVHPPYHDIIRFSEDKNDLSNCEDIDDFYFKFESFVINIKNYIEKGKYAVLVIGDIYKNGEVVPLSSLCSTLFLDNGFKLKGIVVKNIANNRAKRNRQNLWRYRHLRNGTWEFEHEYLYFFERK